MPSKKIYKLDNITGTVTDSGPQPMKEFWHLYCIICEKDPNIITAFLKQHGEGLGVNAKVKYLISNFDALTIPPVKSEYTGW